MALKTVLSSLLVLAVCLVSSLSAGKFTITVRNEIDDKDDPICLKSVNVSIGKIEKISHLEGDPIGKEFNVTLSMPEIEVTAIYPYLDSLSKEGKILDYFILSNLTKTFSFSAFLTGVGTTWNPEGKNLHYHFLPSNKGYKITDIEAF